MLRVVSYGPQHVPITSRWANAHQLPALMKTLRPWTDEQVGQCHCVQLRTELHAQLHAMARKRERGGDERIITGQLWKEVER